jgi:hypothetical protein
VFIVHINDNWHNSSPSLRHPVVHDVFHRVEECHDTVRLVGMMLLSVKTWIRVCWMSYCKQLSHHS